ncbi:APC family permease [Cryptosporangium aurantiacum]|uniref:Amino acid transporter n=1 Tax=Cryptosporangium aurantiacum TaxID=134849 RepID=A0A1M7RNA7_9ACTN|nr:APC family permease [Cryptosporangium aurantiacum]SHN47562.1 Amino acid transporter [Cryptosporangium aurantiacum]
MSGTAPNPPRSLAKMLVLTAIVVAVPAPITLLSGGVGSIGAATGVLGLPLLYSALGAIMLVSAAAWSAAARQIPDAKGLYTFAGRGLGAAIGYGVAALGALTYASMTIANVGLIGEEIVTPLGDAGISVEWWMIAVPVVALIGFLGTTSFKVRAIVLAAIVVIQLPGIFLFDLSALTKPGPDGITPEALDPTSVFSGSIGAAVGFLALTYVGVEAGRVFQNESGAGRKTASKATYLGILGLVVLYATSTWLVTVVTGGDDFVVEARENPIFLVPDSIEANFGAGAANAFFLITTVSTVGALLAFHSLAARHFQVAAADGLLPAWFAKEHGPRRVPLHGSWAMSGLTIVVLLVFAVAGAKPYLGVFLIMSHLGALSAVLMFVVVFFAIAVYFLRSDSESDGFFGWEGVLIAALTAGVALASLLVLTVAESDARLDVEPGSLLTWLLPILVALTFVAGIVRAQLVRSSRPDLLERLAGTRKAAESNPDNWDAGQPFEFDGVSASSGPRNGR